MIKLSRNSSEVGSRLARVAVAAPEGPGSLYCHHLYECLGTGDSNTHYISLCTLSINLGIYEIISRRDQRIFFSMLKCSVYFHYPLLRRR